VSIHMGARARAFGLLLLTATFGATLGIMGDRLIAQQRTGELTAREAVVEPDATQVDEPQPADPVDTVKPAPSAPQPDVTAAPQTQPVPDAQIPGGPEPMPRGFALPRPPVPYADRMFALLDLTPEQRLAVDSLMAMQQERVRELTERIQPRFQAIMRETNQQVNRVLTPEQRARLRTLQQERNRLMDQGEIRPPQQMRQMQTREEILRQLRDERMRGRQPNRQRVAPPKTVLPDTGMIRR
jgi:Spy/CpxP family protein refolding chaperone